MTDYYTAAQVRELDRIAIEEMHIPGFHLMQLAAAACFRELRSNWPDVTDVAVCCGTGNNGGDGLVLAALCSKAGIAAQVFLLGDPARIRGDARLALEMARECGVSIRDMRQFPAEITAPHQKLVLVDALLGTGLSGSVREDFATAIAGINESGMPVLSVDIPSGLCSDTGEVLGSAVRADVTVTFIGRKLGMIRGQGAEFCGKCVFDDLSVPDEVYARVNPACQR